MQHFKLLTIFSLLFCVSTTQAQQSVQDSVARERQKLVTTHMTVLGAWAAANIVQGSISASGENGSNHFFHQFNAYWNIANLALAVTNLVAVKHQRQKTYHYSENLHAQYQLEKVILFNAGLDLGYLATGLYLKERGNRINSDQATGYGNSLLLQGGFLLVFDIIQYAAHHKNTKWLEKNAASWQFGPTGNGLGLSYRFK